ncbi:hypothetical protein N0V84_012177 [Fusarium piperis]|uniref:Uncharacterized protein n=1 Tax=Fusarium piperis TaxID=1435070 RepID=A0A9W8TCG3_9HYPO|nr:hypothetical protein N0V84_012177 [Fusarium piperis]
MSASNTHVDAMEHRNISSLFHRGLFSQPWIGDNPTLDQRRQYIRAYLEWRLPHEDMEKQERELRDLAERKAAMVLINDRVVEVGGDQFEWLVDKKFWQTWLSYLGNPPPFPWRCPQDTSQAFARWLHIFRTEGDLVKGWKASEPAERTALPPPKMDLRDIFPKDTFQLVAPGLLREFPPLTFPEIGAETSGLDCLVQLIRHSYAFCTRHDRIEEESLNPILA